MDSDTIALSWVNKYVWLCFTFHRPQYVFPVSYQLVNPTQKFWTHRHKAYGGLHPNSELHLTVAQIKNPNVCSTICCTKKMVLNFCECHLQDFHTFELSLFVILLNIIMEKLVFLTHVQLSGTHHFQLMIFSICFSNLDTCGISRAILIQVAINIKLRSLNVYSVAWLFCLDLSQYGRNVFTGHLAEHIIWITTGTPCELNNGNLV